jgi:hypothetical protein
MEPTHKCLLCDRGSDVVPLISIEYHGNSFHICSQHLPVLIHDPGQLAGLLPGAEALTPADHKD